MKTRLLLCLIGVFAVGVFSGPVPSADCQTIPVPVAYASLSASNSPLWVAKESGVFERQGLDVKPIFMEGATRSMASLLAGNTPIMMGGTGAVVLARAQGADAFIIAGVMNLMPFHLIVSSSVRSPGDLKGKRLGISRFGSSSEFAVRRAVQVIGLDPDREVKILQIGTASTRFAAMESGALDGTVVEADLLPLVDRTRYHVLVDLTRENLPYQHVVFAATKKTISSRPEILTRFMKGWIEGLRMYRSDKELVMKTLAKYTKIKDRGTLEVLFENYRDAFALPPFPTFEGIQTVIDGFKGKVENVKEMKPAEIVDLSILQRLEKEGAF